MRVHRLRSPLCLAMALLVAAAFLAGCSGSPPTPPVAPCVDEFTTPATGGPKATSHSGHPSSAAPAPCVPEIPPQAGTGAIRCVVVDAAVRPIAGAKVSTTVAGRGTVETMTGANGGCALTGLPAGTYFLTASKQGYFSAQTSVDVRAGVSPPVTKVQLMTDLATTPYYATSTFSGYIECSVTTPVYARAVCAAPNQAAPNTTNDRFVAFHPLDRRPTWIQHEMVWDSTQQAGSAFQLVSSYATSEEHQAGQIQGDLNSTVGTSPLILIPSAGDIARTRVGENGTGLVPRVFAGGADQTVNAVCDPTNSKFLGFGTQNCLFGTGATLEQSFTIYTHVFYGYAPPQDWTFGNDGDPPMPA